jgi:ankyrin repeat protein
MRRLFDPENPYFASWRESYDIDVGWWSFEQRRGGFALSPKSTPSGEAYAPICLYYSALCGFRDLTKHLIAKYPKHVNARVGSIKCPLAAALGNRHFQVAELLRQHGAVLHIGFGGRTLLHAASKDGLMDVAQWLLNIGADAKAREDDHTTPLHFAAANGNLELVQTLLRHSVDVNAPLIRQNFTPLHEASQHGHVDVARVLILQGANVNAEIGRYWTPLHSASYSGNPETARLLIHYGAEVNAVDGDHWTPLHLAASQGDTNVIQLLVDHGADVKVRTRTQGTPLHLASSAGKGEAVQLLTQLGADVNA